MSKPIRRDRNFNPLGPSNKGRGKNTPDYGKAAKPEPKKPETKAKPREVRNKSLPKKKGSGGGNRKIESTARRLTQGILNEEMEDLRAQRREVNRAAQDATTLARTDYQRGVGDLKHIYGETGNYLNDMNQQNQQMYGAASLEQSAAAAALQKQLGGIYDMASKESAGLGVDSLQGDLNSNEAFAKSLGAITGSNTQDNLALASQNAGQLGNLLSGMNQGSFISSIGQNLNSRNDTLSGIAQERSNQQNLVREAIRDARGSRKDVFFQLLTQLKQSGWGENQKKKAQPKKPVDKK